MVDADATNSLVTLATKNRCHVAVNFQMCFLQVLSSLQLKYKTKNNVVFSGCFSISRNNRLDIESKYNLGSHLLAIREYVFPFAKIGVVESAYESVDSRFFSLNAERESDVVDLIKNDEPLLQIFIQQFEQGLKSGKPLFLDLPFALRVTESLRNIESL
jgi:hypothetical protein